jgi:hypothetical protein
MRYDYIYIYYVIVNLYGKSANRHLHYFMLQEIIYIQIQINQHLYKYVQIPRHPLFYLQWKERKEKKLCILIKVLLRRLALYATCFVYLFHWISSPTGGNGRI